VDRKFEKQIKGDFTIITKTELNPPSAAVSIAFKR
jgi:hypothetical protein